MSNSTHKGKMVTQLDVHMGMCMETLPCKHYVTVHYADGTTEKCTFGAAYIMQTFGHLVSDEHTREHLIKNFQCRCCECAHFGRKTTKHPPIFPWLKKV